MKKTILAFGTSIACLLLLAACTDATAPITPTPVSPSSQNTSVDTKKNDQQTSLTINSSSEEILEAESTLITPTMQMSTMQTFAPVNEEPNTADQKAFDQAVATSDETKCEALTDPKAKILCQSKVNQNKSDAEVKGITQE